MSDPTQLQQEPLPYNEVLRRYKAVKQQDPSFSDWTLPQFAGTMNDVSGSNRFSEGLNDSMFRRASAGFDSALEATHLPQAAQSAGEFVGKPFGDAGSQMFGQAFRQIPRMAAVGAAGAGIAVGAGALGLPAAGATMLGMGLATGADALGRTGSWGQGMFQGALGAAGAGVAGPASNLAIKALGGEAVGDVVPNLASGAAKFLGEDSPFTRAAQDLANKYTYSGTILDRGIQHLGSIGASQGSFGVVNELGNMADRMVHGQDALPTGQDLLKDAIQQLPFAAFDVIAPHIGLHQSPEQLANSMVKGMGDSYANKYLTQAKELGGGSHLDIPYVRKAIKDFLLGSDENMNLGNATAYQSKETEQNDSNIIGEMMGKRLFGDVGKRIPYVDAVKQVDSLLDLKDPTLRPPTEIFVQKLVEAETKLRAQGKFDPAQAMDDAAEGVRAWTLDKSNQLAMADPEAGREMRQAAADHVDAMLNGQVDARMAAMQDDPDVSQALKHVNASTYQPVGLGLGTVIERPGTFDKLTGRRPQVPELDRESGQLVPKETQYSQASSIPDRNTPEVSAAAQRAAYSFFYSASTGERKHASIDWSNPSQVQEFDNYVSRAMNDAQASAVRSRDKESTLPGIAFDQSKPDSFLGHSDAESAAHAEANKMNADSNQTGQDAAFEYSAVPDRGKPGVWKIQKKAFDKTLSLDKIQEDAQDAAKGLDFSDEEAFKQQVGDDWTGDPTVTNEVSSQLDRLNQDKDPATREAKRDLLISNMLDMVDKLPDETIKKLFKVTADKSGRFEGLGRFRARLYRYLQFLGSDDSNGFKLQRTPVATQKAVQTFDTRAEAEEFAAKTPGSTVREGLMPERQAASSMGGKPTEDFQREGEGFKKETLLPQQPTVTKEPGYRYTVMSPNGPKIDRLDWERPSHIPPGGVTPVDKLLATLGDSIPANNKAGFLNVRDERATKLASSGQQLNFFETMELLMKEVAKGFQDPKDLTRRPVQLQGFLPPGLTNPPVGFVLDHIPTVYRTPEHQVPQEAGRTNMVPHSFVWTDTKGNSQVEEGKSTMYPSERMAKKLQETGGTMSGQGYVRQFVQDYGARLSPEVKESMSLLWNLENQRKGYVDMPIGFAVGANIGKKGATKGLYVPGGGIMMTTYNIGPKGKVVLDAPEVMAPHIIHEGVHAAIQSLIANDPNFKARLIELMKTAKGWIDKQNEDNARKRQYGEAAPDLIDVKSFRGIVENPDEFMAQFMTPGSAEQALLHKMPDDVTLPSPTKMTGGSMFQKLWGIVKDGFSKVFGLQGPTLADRVRAMMEEGIAKADARGQEFDPNQLRDSVANWIYTDGQDVVGPMLRKRVPKGEPMTVPSTGFTGGVTLRPDEQEAAHAEGIQARSDIKAGTRLPPVLESKEPDKDEYISGIAIRNPKTKEVYSEPSGVHYQLMDKVSWAHDITDENRDMGWVTNKGKFVPRYEATKFAKKTRQFTPSPEDVDEAKRWGEEERADAGNVDTSGKGVLESREPIFNALRWSADDVEKEPDGSITFKPLRGLSLADIGSRFGDKVRLSPQDQSEMLEELKTTKLQGEAESVMRNLPVATSTYTTIKNFSSRRGWSELQADNMAGAATRLSLMIKGAEQARATELGTKVSGGVAWIGANSYSVLRGMDLPYTLHTVAHELFHLAANGPYTGHLVDLFNDLGPDNVQAVRTAASILSRFDRFDDPNFNNSVTKPQEFWADIGARLASSLTGEGGTPPSAIQSFFNLGSQKTSEFLRAGIKSFQDVLDGLKQASKDAWLGRIDKPLEAVISNLQPYVKSIQTIEELESQFHAARNIFPDSFKQINSELQRSAIQDVEASRTPETVARYLPTPVFESRDATNAAKVARETLFPAPDEKLGWWSRNIANFYQVADEHPIMRPVVDALMAASGLTNSRIKQLESLHSGTWSGDSAFAKQRKQDIVSFVRSEPMNDAYSKVAQSINKDLQQKPTGEWLETELSKYLKDPEQKRIVGQVLQTSWDQNMKLQQVMSESWEHSIEVVGAKVAQAVTRGATSVDGARQGAKLVRQAYELQRDYPDPLKPLNVTQQINQLRSQAMQLFDPKNPMSDAANQVMAKLDGLNSNLMDYEAKMREGFGWWTSERRFGDFSMLYKDKQSGQIERWVGKTKDARDAFIQQQRLKPDDISAIYNDQGKQGGARISSPTLDSLDQAMQRVLQKVEGDPSLGKDIADLISQNVDVSGDLRAALLAKDITNPTTPRKFGFGRKYMNMYDTQQDYVHAVIYAAKNRFLKAESDLALGQPDFATQPDLANYARQHIDNVLKPDTNFGRMLQMTNFTYFLAGNLGVMMMHPFQQLMELAPQLTKNGASLGDSYKWIGAANAEWARSVGYGKNEFRDPDVNNAMKVWRERGQADTGAEHELQFDQDLAYVQSIKAAGGIGNYGLFDLLKNKAYVAAKQMQRFYMSVPTYNGEISLIAAYKMLRDQGMTHEAATDQAAYIKQLAMGSGGKNARPVGLFTLHRTIAQTMYSLGSYSNAMMSMMASLTKQAFVGKGLTPAQHYQVRLAAAQMLGTQFVLGGVLGMPFVASGIAALQKLFPDMNIEQSVRDFLGNVDKHDDGSEGMIGNMITRGVPNAFSMGPNFSARFQMGGTLGVSPYTGVDAAAIFGPTGSIVQNMIKAGQAAKEGNVPETIDNLLPRGFNNLWKGATEGSSSYDSKGRMLVNDLTKGEQVGKAMGFEPNRVAALRTGSRMSALNNEAEKVKAGARNEKMATMLLSGDGGQVSSQLADEAAKSGQDYKALAEGVASKVEEKTMPLDPRMQGNKLSAAEQQRLVGLLGHDLTNLPTMQDRAMLHMQVMSQLGVPQSGHQLGQAASEDYLMQQTPGLVRQQALALLSHARRLGAPTGTMSGSQ